MVTQRSQRGQAMFDLLRQLSLGLSTYRLFPDDPEQSGFVAAVERIRDAARRTLATGSRHAEVRTGTFRDADGAELTDEHVDRLAQACFSRGVEHLVLRDVPSSDELRQVFEVLSLPEGEVAEGGGVPSLLQLRGVVSLRLGTVAPEADEDGGTNLGELTAEQLDLYRTVLDPERFAANLLVAGLDREPATAAQDVYRRFETVRAILPVSITADPTFVQNLIRVVEALPGGVRREFAAHAVTRARAGDELAQDYLGSMTDTELADALVEIQRAGGPAALEIAEDLVGRVGRQVGIVEVTTAFLEARGLLSAEGTSLAHLDAASAGAAGESEARETAADLFASRLVSSSDRDIQQLRSSYPADVQAWRMVAMDAFRDYLRNETDRERFGQALETWSSHLRDAMAAADDELVDRLFSTVEAAGREARDTGRRELLDQARARVLNDDLVLALAERAKHETEIATVVDTLKRLGPEAQEPLLDVLAVEENRGTRAVLVSMVSDVAQDTDTEPIVARLQDDRWFVVRNAVTILGRLADRAGLRHLTGLVGHPHPQVRRELVRAMVVSAGTDAVPYLERFGRDPDHQVRLAAVSALGALVAPQAAQALGQLVRSELSAEERRRALDELVRHPAPVATDVLADLAARSGRPRLPRAVRKHARTSLARRRKTT